MTAAELAQLMNATESDVRAFVDCLSVWTAKGYSFEDAIAKHLRQMELLAANLPYGTRAARDLVVSAFFPA